MDAAVSDSSQLAETPQALDMTAFLSEVQKVMISQSAYHARMELMRTYYKYSIFNSPHAGEMPISMRKKWNFLKVFGRKNILYTSAFPRINVPTTGPSEVERSQAANRERLLLSTWQRSGEATLQARAAFDGTVRSVAIFLTERDLKNRLVTVRRLDPQQCFWALADDDDNRIGTFWHVTAITKDAAQKRYGITPTSNPIEPLALRGSTHLSKVDGQEWFCNILRVDGSSRVRVIGDKIAEVPHNHLMGGIPVDYVMPFNDGDMGGAEGAFYLEDLLDMQAELNDIIWRRSQVVKAQSNPTTWARGLQQGKAFDDFMERQKTGRGGGMLALSANGDIGILQLNDVQMLNTHKKELLEDMQRVAGFSAATFGESVGANTSGDALGMYFTPTQKLVESQNIHWIAAYKSINAKILKCYDLMLQPNETIDVEGFMPRGTFIAADAPGLGAYAQGAFASKVSREDIAGHYTSLVTMPLVTPKNEIEEKRFWKEAAKENFISFTTAYEEIGLQSPEAELAMLRQERSDPLLNPEGTSKIMQSALAAQPVAPASVGM